MLWTMALLRRIALAGAVAALLSGCGGGPGAAPPTGVDGLEIPTPSPDPADFVAHVDNPWLPLEPGYEWVYDVTGEDPGTATVTVLPGTHEVAGVATTVVRDLLTDTGGNLVRRRYAWFAQDTDGNVWYFGEDTTRYGPGGRRDSSGSWEAGIDGAPAGLAMAAAPRVGDGYEMEAVPHVAGDRALVLALDGEAAVGYGRFSGMVVTEETTPLDPDRVERRYYARGVGPVLATVVSGGTGRAELVSFTHG